MKNKVLKVALIATVLVGYSEANEKDTPLANRNDPTIKTPDRIKNEVTVSTPGTKLIDEWQIARIAQRKKKAELKRVEQERLAKEKNDYETQIEQGKMDLEKTRKEQEELQKKTEAEITKKNEEIKKQTEAYKIARIEVLKNELRLRWCEEAKARAQTEIFKRDTEIKKIIEQNEGLNEDEDVSNALAIEIQNGLRHCAEHVKDILFEDLLREVDVTTDINAFSTEKEPELNTQYTEYARIRVKEYESNLIRRINVFLENEASSLEEILGTNISSSSVTEAAQPEQSISKKSDGKDEGKKDTKTSTSGSTFYDEIENDLLS